jgi:hypothetical protein
MNEKETPAKTRTQFLRDAFEGIKGRQPMSDDELNPLSAGQYFTCSWTHSSGEPSGKIYVRTEPDAVVLSHLTRHCLTNQRAPLVGLSATSAGDVLGSSVRCTATAGTVDDGGGSLRSAGILRVPPLLWAGLCKRARISQ